MIKEIQDYFADCPVLNNAAVNIDCLGPTSGSVSINSDKGESIIKSYRTGGSLRQYRFNISLRCPYTGNAADGLKNEQLCEELCRWIETENDNGRLPLLTNGLTAQSLEVISSGYEGYESSNHTHYTIGLRLIYTKL